MLRSTLQASLADVASDDLDVSSGELMGPTEEVLIRLKTVAKEAREKRIALLQKLRSLDDQEASTNYSLPDQLENVIENTQYIEHQINHYLFKAKELKPSSGYSALKLY